MVPDICRILKMFFSTMPGNLVNLLLRNHVYPTSKCLTAVTGWYPRIYMCYDHTRFRKKPAIKDSDGRTLKNPDDKWKHNAW